MGIDYRVFLNEYRYFYVSNFSDIEIEEPSNKNQLSKPWRKDLAYKSKLSPNGEFLAYSVNNKGKYKVKIRDVESGSEKTILRGGQKNLTKIFIQMLQY